MFLTIVDKWEGKITLMANTEKKKIEKEKKKRKSTC